MENPVLLCSPLDPVEALFVVETPRSAAFVAALKRLSPVPVHALANDPAHSSDVWMQDAVEFAVQGTEPVALLGLRGKHDRGLMCGPLDRLVEQYLAETLPSVKRLKIGEPKSGRRWQSIG